MMLDREAAMRADKRLTNRLAVARLRFADACIDSMTPVDSVATLVTPHALNQPANRADHA
ncbi:hypothetical protein [Mesorhizobium sp. M0701]|uniref:hypothetical protein n=1 Tax=Mesorhizobium sp. M0701 TaxID=2956989 RepID=UPI00333B6BFB